MNGCLPMNNSNINNINRDDMAFFNSILSYGIYTDREWMLGLNEFGQNESKTFEKSSIWQVKGFLVSCCVQGLISCILIFVTVFHCTMGFFLADQLWTIHGAKKSYGNMSQKYCL